MIPCRCAATPLFHFSLGSGLCGFEKLPPPTILAWECPLIFPYARPGGENNAMAENLEWLKRRIPLLEYLQRHNWKPCRTGSRRFVQLFFDLPFRQTVALLEQELKPAPVSQLLEQTAAFYQFQLHRHPEALRYLEHRGLRDPDLIEEMGIGYAP